MGAFNTGRGVPAVSGFAERGRGVGSPGVRTPRASNSWAMAASVDLPARWISEITARVVALAPTRRFAPGGPLSPRRPALGWLAPAISEAGVVLDLVEGGVEGAELVADAFDRRPDVRPITLSPFSSDEAFMAQAVVDGAVGHEVAGF
jgi:hypothetical protein